MSSDDLETYSYSLPEELIAKEPPARREDARLMVLDRTAQTIRHLTIRDLPGLLRAGDCLVLNDTRVLPARLIGHRSATGGRWEGLFLRATGDGLWQLMGQTRGHLQPGETLTLTSIHEPDRHPPLTVQLLSKDEEGLWTASPQHPDPAFDLLQRYGTLPLPPYMQRTVAEASDRERYQTTYASAPGSVAAPTAGLHFTPELLSACEARGIDRARVTLHVGIGTFRPISVSQLSQHRMHQEWCELAPETASKLADVKASGGRVVAVGTTSVRTLETAAQSGAIAAWSGETSLFLRPGSSFHAVDCLLTNFHLPKSSLLVLVCAFAGTDFIKAAYEAAVAERYRFFSYGDAMLIL